MFKSTKSIMKQTLNLITEINIHAAYLEKNLKEPEHGKAYNEYLLYVIQTKSVDAYTIITKKLGKNKKPTGGPKYGR